MTIKDVLLSIHDGKINRNNRGYVMTDTNFDYEVPLVLNVPKYPGAVDLNSICGMVKMRKDGVNIMGDVKIYDTPSGNILKDLINSGTDLFVCGASISEMKQSSEVEVKEYKSFFISIDHADERIKPLNDYVKDK